MLSSLPDVILEGYVVEAVVGNIHRATICGPTNILANLSPSKSERSYVRTHGPKVICNEALA